MKEVMSIEEKYPRVFATEEDLELARSIHEFVDEEIMPNRRNLEGGPERDEKLARKTFKKLQKGLVDMGVQRAFFPKEIGGLGISSMITNQIIGEEIARGDVGLATHMLIIPWPFIPARIFKNETVMRKFAVAFCRDEPLAACMAITEPSGGANIEDPAMHGRTVETTAKLEGDEWVINGEKMWPSGAGISEIYCTVCTVDPEKGDDGIALIFVPKDADGLSFSKPEEKMGQIYTDVNAAIYYDDVRVPEEYCVAGPGGDGATMLHHITSVGRLSSAALALGAAQACFEIGVEYTRKRKIGDKAVRERSMHAGMLGKMITRIQAARSFHLTTAYMFDHDKIYGWPSSARQLGRASAAKFCATKATNDVASKIMELMGAYGYSPEYHVEKYMRDVKIVDIWLGGPQLASLEAARGVYKFEPW